jgi:glycosyltransferase involved in cell wall biosynthesis
MKKVSIIIPTKNEEAHIGTLLKSIQTQTYSAIETIIIDNRSSDRTVDIASQFHVIVLKQGPERSSQRNFGAQKAKGEYFLFLDADMKVLPGVVDECVQQMSTKAYNALVIPEKSIGTGFWAQCKALERSFYEGIDWMEAARFYKKDVFLKLHGYDESLTGPEDFDLPQRLKERYGAQSIGRISTYLYHDEGEFSLWSSLRKKFYYGKKMHVYLQKSVNVHAGLKQGSIIARFALYFSNPRKLFRHPIIGVGMLAMKLGEMVALSLGYIVGLSK